MQFGLLRSTHICRVWVILGVYILAFYVSSCAYTEKGVTGTPQICAVKLDVSSDYEVKNKCPEEVNAQLVVEHSELTLSLVLSKAIYLQNYGGEGMGDNIPVIISTGDHLTLTWKPQKLQDSGMTCFYQDLTTAASVSITFTNAGHEMLGSFIQGNHSRVILPASKSHERIRRQSTNKEQDHIVYTQQPELAERRKRGVKEIKRIKRQAITYNNYVEYLVIIDYSLYRRFYDETSTSSSTSKYQEAINNIYYYYSHVLNEMDTAYSSITDNDFKISIKLTAFHIAIDSSASPWTELPENTNGDAYVNVNSALESLRNWASSQQGIPQFDHAAVFTAKNLFFLDDGAFDDGVVGQAYLSTICKLDSVSINEDDGLFRTSSIAAHELGHSLGAVHDGVDNSCDGNDQYIMTANSDYSIPTNIVNSKSFSTCSIAEIKSMLVGLANNCLQNIASNWDENVYEENLNLKPGQVYDLQEQCRIKAGQGSKYCGEQSYVENICHEIRCSNINDGLCYTYYGLAALDGTICGDKKWCENGECVYNSNAPSADGSCIYGDIPFPFSVPNYGLMTCAQFVGQSPRNCYNDANRDLCCATCKENFRDNSPGCEYGDYSSFCSTISDTDCYLNAATCCETCLGFDTGDPNCQYGDKLTGCQSDYCETSSSSYRMNCCKTCGLVNPVVTPSTTTTTTTATTSTTTVTPSTYPNTASCEYQPSMLTFLVPGVFYLDLILQI